MKKYLLLSSLIAIVLLLYSAAQFVMYSDHKLHVVVCDVGQGDGTFVRTPLGKRIVLDGGPDEKILSCIARHSPFWEKSIDLVLLSHPHADHIAGLIPLTKSFTLRSFATEPLKNNTQEFSDLMENLSQDKVTPQYILSGNGIQLPDGPQITLIGPSKAFLDKTSPHGIIGESAEFASLETLLTYNTFSMLFTGDSQASELLEGTNHYGVHRLSVLQVPHHGSRTGLSEEVLKKLQPQLAIISVGKDNKYGHPSPLTLLLLKAEKIPVLRTDEKGDVEIVSDGSRWRVK